MMARSVRADIRSDGSNKIGFDIRQKVSGVGAGPLGAQALKLVSTSRINPVLNSIGHLYGLDCTFGCFLPGHDAEQPFQDQRDPLHFTGSPTHEHTLSTDALITSAAFSLLASATPASARSSRMICGLILQYAGASSFTFA